MYVYQAMHNVILYLTLTDQLNLNYLAILPSYLASANLRNTLRLERVSCFPFEMQDLSLRSQIRAKTPRLASSSIPKGTSSYEDNINSSISNSNIRSVVNYSDYNQPDSAILLKLSVFYIEVLKRQWQWLYVVIYCIIIICYSIV